LLTSSVLQWYSRCCVFSRFNVPPICPNTDTNSLTGIIPTELGALKSLGALYFSKYIATKDVLSSHCLMFLLYCQIQLIIVLKEAFQQSWASCQAWNFLVSVSILNSSHTFSSLFHNSTLDTVFSHNLMNLKYFQIQTITLLMEAFRQSWAI
jgi:hypothetical protein